MAERPFPNRNDGEQDYYRLTVGGTACPQVTERGFVERRFGQARRVPTPQLHWMPAPIVKTGMAQKEYVINLARMLEDENNDYAASI